MFLVAPVVGWWLPSNVSSNFGGVDTLFYMILAITGVFFLFTESVLVYNMYTFASAPGLKAEYSHGNMRLELLWTIVPGILLVLLSYLQINAWEVMKYESRMPAADGNTLQMVVVARQWEWRIRYPSSRELISWETDKARAEQWRRSAAYPYEDLMQPDDVHVVNEIHSWREGQNIVHLKTRDVIHSFFLPNLRQKQDALPGKVIPVWFTANDYNTTRNGNDWVHGFDPATGKWDQIDRAWPLACAEFCGDRHSMMRGKLFVHRDKADFLEWLRMVEARQNQHSPGASR
jgi:cytochrome c oxidase subunit 2